MCDLSATEKRVVATNARVPSVALQAAWPLQPLHAKRARICAKADQDVQFIITGKGDRGKELPCCENAVAWQKVKWVCDMSASEHVDPHAGERCKWLLMNHVFLLLPTAGSLLPGSTCTYKCRPLTSRSLPAGIGHQTGSYTS